MRQTLGVFFLLFACSKTQAPPSTQAASTTVSQSSSAVVSASQALPPIEVKEQVVGLVVDKQLIPLACVDVSKKKILAKKDCFRYLPKGSKLKLQDNRELVLGDKSTWVCTPTGEEQASIQIETALPEQPSLLGLGYWPVERELKRFVSMTTLDQNAPLADYPTLKKLTPVLEKESPSKDATLRVQQQVQVDLNGDGQDDTVYSIYQTKGSGSASQRSEDTYEYSAILLEDGKTKKIHVLEESSMDRYLFLGATDLDGDHRNELWIQSAYYEGDAFGVYQLKGDTLEEIAAWGCGA